jgi:quercetin dioxygenase-like cupin family protein
MPFFLVSLPAEHLKHCTMIIDFNKLNEEQIFGFKGGKGELDTRNYTDEKCKIMYSTLKPGASSGLHSHDQNCEIIYVLRGKLTFHYDDKVEEAVAGQAHYCPMGHSHYMENLTSDDVTYFAVVPEHH